MQNSKLENTGHTLAAQDIDNRLVRYAELLPGKAAFIDARTPGSDQKENYCIIGAGVAENPDQPVHILDDKGFDVGGAGQPVGIKNSLHSHASAEIFIIFRGQFRLYWGNEGQQEAVLGPGDMVSIPTNCFRGFEVVGNEYGFLFAFLGADAGGVTWHPQVIEEAKQYGLILLENGKLVDTVAGHRIPDTIGVMPPLTAAELASFDNPSVQEMLSQVARKTDYRAVGKPFTEGSFKQYNLSGSASSSYDFQIKSEDGLCVFAFEMDKGSKVPLHQRSEPEVLINFSGDTLLTLVDASSRRAVLLTKGDTFNLPLGIAYQLECVRGQSFVYSTVKGDRPDLPRLM